MCSEGQGQNSGVKDTILDGDEVKYSDKRKQKEKISLSHHGRI